MFESENSYDKLNEIWWKNNMMGYEKLHYKGNKTMIIIKKKVEFKR